ncbi:hypothetical protein HXZ68_09380 [Acinetobacter indicus]|uniref:O-antigen ligase family protein n=1 Tax=Acinetobacter indicus TaxID=756892 RepID=UPI002578E3A7|nr:O-antigen ligase family protein [Acinetobacter indicus]MDM1263166.1 hypothetical protein [Acinetobacter indicus]
MLKININKYFIFLLILSPFVAYFINYGILAYGPFLILGFFVVASGLKNIRFKELNEIILIIPFTLLALFSYFLNPYLGEFFNTHLIVLLISFPLIIAVGRINELSFENRLKYLILIIKTFLAYQVFICFGQFLKYKTGFGFDAPLEFQYLQMIPGSFANSNDLSSVLVLILYAILTLEKNIEKKEFYSILFVVLILLVLSASRLALVISLIIFCFRNINSIKNIVINLANLILITSVSLFLVFLFGGGRSFEKIRTIFDIYNQGFSADNSASIRLDSYGFFLNNIDKIGMGSFKINDYFIYSNSTESAYINDLMFQNPHSLFVEVGYWLGYWGLFFLFLYLCAFFKNHNGNKLIFMLTFLVVTTISSSILGSFLFFSFFIIVALFDYSSKMESSG